MTPRRTIGAALVATSMFLAGCSDDVPTSVDPGLIPVDATTFEVRLPFDEFARDFRIDGGYGAVTDLGYIEIAHGLETGYEARPLLRFGGFAPAISVIPPGGTTAQLDSSWVAVGGEIVLVFDSLAADDRPSYEFEIGAIDERWDPTTASWSMAVDTLGDRVAWSQPGGGNIRSLGTVLWEPAEGDSVHFEVDSLTASHWVETTNLARGTIVMGASDDTRLRLQNVVFRVDARGEVNPDTIVRVVAASRSATFLYAPEPSAPEGMIPVGGAPAFRTTFRLAIPDSVETSGPICAGAQTCWVDLLPERVVYAGLNLRSTAPPDAGMAPADSLVLDLRPVLAADRLPRSPLGFPIRPQGVILPPTWFGEDAGTDVDVPVTLYVRDLLRREDPDGNPIPSTVSLLSAVEPSRPGVATFAGPGTEGEPFLRIILTRSEGVRLP